MSNLLNIKDQSGNWIPIPVVTNGIKSITQNEDYTLTITLNDGTTYTTTSIKGEDGQDYILTEQDKQDIAGLVDTPVDDVQINGQSIVENGVANVPIADGNTAGVAKINPYFGIGIFNGQLMLNAAQISDIKNANTSTKAVSTVFQHASTFYGLAKASGDTTQSQSDNEVGVYTDEAKASIKNMLGVEDVDIDSKAPVITETVSGDIVSFDDGADDMPLQSLVVDIEPVQDLHGYDSPWVGGGGKNLFNIDAPFATPSDTTSANTTKRIFTPGTYCIGIAYSNYFSVESVLSFSRSDKTLSISTKSGYGVGFAIAVTPGQQYFISCTAQSPEGINHFIQVEQYTADGEYLTIDGVNRINDTFTAKENAAVAVLMFRNSASDGNPAISTFTDIQVESGSTATDYAPYENICPISGWTGCEVQRTGINIFDGEVESGDYDVTEYKGGAKRSNAERMRCANFIPVKPNTTYYSKMPYSNSVVVFYDEEKWMRSNGGYVVARNTTFTTPSWCKYITFYFNGTEYNNDISINYPATDHDYHPYTGRSIAIDLGQTVYGGYVDVTGGELVVDSATRTLDGTEPGWTINVNNNNPKRTYAYNKNASMGDILTTTEIISSYIPSTIFSGNNEVEGIYVDPAGYLFIRTAPMVGMTALVNWTTYLSNNPLQVVYKLAKPIHYPLTPTEIKSLLGTNNIWSDCGDTEVEYRADTELYIDKQIPDVPVDDVQINGTSILQDGVANVPIGGNDLGAVKENLAYGIDITGNGQLLLITPSDIELKKGYSGTRRAIMTLNQHIATFYGLAKAAGDTTQSTSSNAVGEYTSEAKTAIKQMLGVKDDYDSLVVEVSGTDPVITGKPSYRYNCGELYTLSITPPESGTMDIIFTSGATPTVLTLPETVKMPDWWAGIETNTTYEMCITDGTYCGVMSWAT